uniref:Uncharacterized protein n=1 Tax=viral metagenome TaxID=1070528 RepID=A0A6C0KCQ0_9ZZZZ
MFFFVLFVTVVVTAIWFLNRLKNRYTQNIRDTQNIQHMMAYLSDDDVHNIIVGLTDRVVILNWYDKQSMSQITGKPVSDECWNAMLKTQDSLYDESNDMVREWSSSVQEYIEFNEGVNEECNDITDDKEDDKTMEQVLWSLSNSQLRKYAGVTDAGKSKAELVQIIMNHFHHNMKTVVYAKLDKISSLLS